MPLSLQPVQTQRPQVTACLAWVREKPRSAAGPRGRSHCQTSTIAPALGNPWHAHGCARKMLPPSTERIQVPTHALVLDLDGEALAGRRKRRAWARWTLKRRAVVDWPSGDDKPKVNWVDLAG